MTAVNFLTTGGIGTSYSSTPSWNNQAINSSTPKVAFVFQAKSANAITQVGFRYGVRTGTPCVHICGLQGVDLTTGNPDGTYKGGGTPASKTFTPPADTTWNSTFQWQTLANAYTPAIGDYLAVVVEYSSGTADGSNNSSFTYSESGGVLCPSTGGFHFPYSLNYTGSWTKSGFPGPYGVKTASETHGLPIYATNTTSISTSGQRSASTFMRPGTGTYQVIGARFAGIMAAAAAKAPKLVIWEGTTALQSVTLDSDVNQSASGFGFQERIFSGALATLNKGTSYRIGLEVADAANGGLYILGYTVNNGDLGALPGGADWQRSTFASGAWTDDPTNRSRVELILSDETNSAGGGLIVHPGMNARMAG